MITRRKIVLLKKDLKGSSCYHDNSLPSPPADRSPPRRTSSTFRQSSGGFAQRFPATSFSAWPPFRLVPPAGGRPRRAARGPPIGTPPPPRRAGRRRPPANSCRSWPSCQRATLFCRRRYHSRAWTGSPPPPPSPAPSSGPPWPWTTWDVDGKIFWGGRPTAALKALLEGREDNWFDFLVGQEWNCHKI